MNAREFIHELDLAEEIAQYICNDIEDAKDAAESVADVDVSCLLLAHIILKHIRNADLLYRTQNDYQLARELERHLK